MIQILHVEDDVSHHELTRLSLQDLGAVTCERVCSLRDAVANLRMQRFDVILIDLCLPDSDGVETIEQLAAVAPDTILIVLSNKDPLVMGDNAILAGADDFVPKSAFATDQLACAVRHARARRERDRRGFAAVAA